MQRGVVWDRELQRLIDVKGTLFAIIIHRFGFGVGQNSIKVIRSIILIFYIKQPCIIIRMSNLNVDHRMLTRTNGHIELIGPLYHLTRMAA